MSDRDYYEILGLTPGADGAMVDQAYWHLARKYQSLSTTNPRARYMLDELNEAYGVLGLPAMRSQYDAFRDDVLIQKGMIKPVASKPKRTESETAPASERAPRSATRLQVENWRTYGVSGIIMALALAAAWQGVSLTFVGLAMVAGLALSLTPALKRQLSDITMPSVSMPAMPAMPAMPELRAPRIAMPKLSEANIARLRDMGYGNSKDEAVDPGTLHASTAAMIERWRNSVGLLPLAADDPEPSNALVDIVASEHQLEEQSEPLSAVIDILRGAHRSVETT